MHRDAEAISSGQRRQRAPEPSATTEAGRGKGLARHLTLTGLHAAAGDGITTGVLHSTPMAHSLYEKMGFRDAATFRLWATPGDLEL